MVATTGAAAGHENWSSRTAFILAAIGSAVGLGNLVRFPAEAGANGGGAFVIFYIGCIILIGLPVLLSEILIGRHGQAAAPDSVRTVARDSGASEGWSVLATIGMIAAFLILCYYSVIGGWVLHYIGLFGAELFNGGPFNSAFAGKSAEDVQGIMPALFADGSLQLMLHILFIGITIFFVARGVNKGIEFVATWLMPIFFTIFLGITAYGLVTGDFARTFSYLFTFEPEKLTGPVMLAAVGQAFFSLSLGSAMMITYGAYADRNINLGKTSAVIASADTSVALLAGFAIFPIVFAAGLDANSGMGLMFQTLPTAFMTMPAGSLIGFAFFVMVFFAALTSAVALLEAPTSWAIDRFGMGRGRTTLISGGLVLLIGGIASLSTTTFAGWEPLGFIPLFEGQDFFNTLDVLTGKVMLPVAALITAIFVGWIADRKLLDAENGISGWVHVTWRFLVAWLCPIALAAILIVGIFPGIIG
ncbi:sodium-dependent transporter [Sphingomicrobium lutaoense]|uniref:NSS family neurotransmitter:Na+ symporter n=1 Tax=Sphingomicrobium lutaoense TaxID=515949 RepID=A0A839Z573_9SPHN|nr:sodium-dependent transporter [Sphingomicrobium lutaoense]MBB3765033.1 NSS family neurotransmitter:Na+ symporter [Sphingomicrobium lutaoense]